METTQIEKQLQIKVEREITEMVNTFLLDIRGAQKKYGHHSFFYLEDRRGDKNKKISTLTLEEFKTVLVKCLKNNLSEYMLKAKTKELLDKLELL